MILSHVPVGHLHFPFGELFIQLFSPFSIGLFDFFDAEFYAANNPDVVAALGTEELALYTHYVMNGRNEGRRACERRE